MLIEVTAEDMNGAQRKNASHCPVARACQRAGLGCAEVTLSRVYFGRMHARIAALPKEATRFILLWDAGLNPEAFAFDLPLKKGARK